ncbi:hypothetical protein DICPUDRAFT_98973 [Dictyostelium purpureum]|uniref:Uncharacterized protein n=1 Tax=Dictyostelium purpureum TaxID=5786 RepID=F0ZV97_DICPU|nr:uncharacterized protein DICPUDRAFT_98973 [Dictyostelium purpureum]EGC32129.1 hypothetical protein DICPUDRAFT_98973 [Dictyostelium purpureum]|eukprot:XP_003291338.1 hypothetical protein DICPUDRAFT_98973 [Dictyostelium purpureum]
MEVESNNNIINQKNEIRKECLQISYENPDTFIRYLPKDIEKYNENEIRDFLLKVYHENNNSQCKAKNKIDLLNRYLIPLNKTHPQLITNELIKQVLSDYVPIVLPRSIIVENKNQDLSRYWNLYISFNVDGFLEKLVQHLKQLYQTIKTPNFEQYQYMIKYYKAVYPTLNKEMFEFKDYYCSMINNYYKNNINTADHKSHGENSIKMMLEIWYSYLCLCGDQNQNQLEFATFLTKQLKGVHLVDFICLFNRNYFDNPTFNMDAFVLLVASLFDNNDEQNKSFLQSFNDEHKKSTLLEIFKNPKLNQFSKLLNK